MALRHLALACRRAGADDEILGADHDRRHRLAALMHPERLKFPALAGAMGRDRNARGRHDPHLIWLKDVDFVPLTYAGDVYRLSSRAQSAQPRLGMSGTIWRRWRCWSCWRRWRSPGRRDGSRGPGPAANEGVNRAQALIWIISSSSRSGPPLGGLAFTVYMKTDWGFRCSSWRPWRWLRFHPCAAGGAVSIAAIWLVLTLATLAASPHIAANGGIPTAHRATARARNWPRIDRGLAQQVRLAMGGRRRHHRGRRAHDVL